MADAGLMLANVRAEMATRDDENDGNHMLGRLMIDNKGEMC